MYSKTTKLLVLALLFLSSISFAQDDSFTLDGKGQKTHTYKNNTGVTNTELEYRGKIVFTEDETDVKYISPGGFLRFSKRSFGNKRTIILEGESNGGIYREYREGSKKLPFEPDGKRWMASVLPEIIRTTGIGAEERAAKFYAKGGISALLNEISMLPTNYVKGKYYDASFKIPALKAGDMALLIEDAGDKVNSSYELSKLLTNNSDAYGKEEKALAAAIHVTNNISSSYEQAKVYKHLLSEVELNQKNKGEIIKNVRNISSSYEQSGVLQASLKKTLAKENINLVIVEVENMNSSYEQSKVLQALISNQSLADLDLSKFLITVSKISSSYEQGQVLKKLIDKSDLNSNQIITITKSAEFITSSYEQSKFLKSIITEQKLDEASINAVLATTFEISSNYEKSQVVQLIIANPNFRNSNYGSVIKIVSSIGSSYEQSSVLADLIELNSMPDSYMLELIKVVNTISSSYERSKLLQKIGPNLPANKEIRDAFFDAAEGLSNDEYGKVMRTAANK